MASSCIGVYSYVLYSTIIFTRCIHYHFARMMRSKMKHWRERKKKKRIRAYFGNEMRAKFKNEIFIFFFCNSTCNLITLPPRALQILCKYIFNISFSMKCYILCETRYSKLQFPHPRWYVQPTYHGINESLFVLCFHRRSNSSGWTRIRYTWCTIPYIGKLNRSRFSHGNILRILDYKNKFNSFQLHNFRLILNWITYK